MKVNYYCFAMIGLILGVSIMDFIVDSGLEQNSISGYHCTPITKHTGIKSAKAQVSAYQAMTRG